MDVYSIIYCLFYFLSVVHHFTATKFAIIINYMFFLATIVVDSPNHKMLTEEKTNTSVREEHNKHNIKLIRNTMIKPNLITQESFNHKIEDRFVVNYELLERRIKMFKLTSQTKTKVYCTVFGSVSKNVNIWCEKSFQRWVQFKFFEPNTIDQSQ